jgi:hypothetical protein
MNNSHFHVDLIVFVLETCHAFLPNFSIGSSSLLPYYFRSLCSTIVSCLSTMIICNCSLNMENIINTDSVSMLLYSNVSRYILICDHGQ